MKELVFIDLIKQKLDNSSYIGDDTAYIEDGGLLLTTDTLIENVHFRKDNITPYDLGLKSIAVNLSDIASSGGIAKYILVAMSFPEIIDKGFVEEFYRGVNVICKEYGCIVVGGDLTRADVITICVTVIGFTEGVEPATRKLAKKGDVVAVTGNHGSSAAGLWLLENDIEINSYIKEKFIKSHINPIPKLKIGREILINCYRAPAMMDTSDGLGDALLKIAQSSNVDMEIEMSMVPFDEELGKVAKIADVDKNKWIFYGGEDYELVACMSEEDYINLKEKNIPIIKIGKVLPMKAKPDVKVLNGDKYFSINQYSLDMNAYDHFSGK